MRRHLFAACLIAALVIGVNSASAAQPIDAVETACSVASLPEPDLTALQPLPSPQIDSAYRETAGARSTWEEASFSDGHRWTRRGGDDIVVKLANARNGYTLKVYDEAMALLHSEAVSVCDPFVTVTLPTTEGRYGRVFVYTAGSSTGATARAGFGVDTTAPVIQSQERVDESTSRVTFSEPLYSGRNFASDWLASAETDSGTQFALATSVKYVDAQTRLVHFDPAPLEGSPFLGVDYYLTGDEEQRYRDAAGNGVANTLS